MARTHEGLRSEELREALDAALAGRTDTLDALLARVGGLPSPRPNVRLAAAFGEEAAGRPQKALWPLLRHLAEHPASDEVAEVFLPIAAAFTLVSLAQREGREPRELDLMLFTVASDDRVSVIRGVVVALTGLATQPANGADSFVRRADEWMLYDDDRERQFAACASVLEVLADANVLSAIQDADALLAYLGRALALAADASRAAERSPGRRRLLTNISRTVSSAVPIVRGTHAWLLDACSDARRGDIRDALDRAIRGLRHSKLGRADVAALHDALEASKKPPRDPTRTNEQARGRGRKARRKRG